MADYTITIDSNGSPTPNPLPNCRAGDKIKWTNSSTTDTATGFVLPTCVSPQSSPGSIGPGATTREFAINNSPAGSYEYTYYWPGREKGPRNGTIDVGS